MSDSTQGIPGLPDLTHPTELIQFGSQVLQASLLLVFLVIALGIAIALVSFSLRRHESEQVIFVGEWSVRYSQILGGLQHLTVVLVLLVVGFFLCSTLSNRYHHWEQAKVAQVAQSVAGDKLEQIAPRIRYVTQQPFTYTTQVDVSTSVISVVDLVAVLVITNEYQKCRDRSWYFLCLSADFNLSQPLHECTVSLDNHFPSIISADLWFRLQPQCFSCCHYLHHSRSSIASFRIISTIQWSNSQCCRLAFSYLVSSASLVWLV